MPQASKKIIIPRALTIAGSDSGGGAGIQADLKTFAALGIHGTSAITALTAQNTREVTGILDIPTEMVISQIKAVHSDIGFDAVKTGMLGNEEITTAVAEYFAKHRRIAKIVVDPVMVSKSGATLLRKNALNALIEKLLPLSYIVTPNAEEAKILVDWKRKVSSLDQAVDAARKISEYGPKVVIVKGGHLVKSKNAIDVVYQRDSGKVWYLESEWCDTRNTHGTGCVFSAAIAAELAKGYDIEKSLTEAKKFVADAIRLGLGVGQGTGPVNPVGTLLQRGEKILVVQELSRAVEALINAKGFENLIPESRTNFVACGEYSEGADDVAAIPGRITNVFGRPVAVGGVAFGGSDHMARLLLSARRFDGTIRSAINLRYSRELLTVLKSAGLTFSSFNRDKEPKETKFKEGHTMDWAVAHIAKKAGGRLPDAVIDLGGPGKEQMILLFGKGPEDVATRVAKIARGALKAN